MAEFIKNADFSVTPQELKLKSEEVSRELSIMEGAYTALKSLVADTEGYWEGEAGTAFRNMFHKQQSRVEDILRRMKDHPAHLMEIAGIHEEAEHSLEQANESLPMNPLD